MTILEKIETHGQAVLLKQIPPDLTHCPCCKKEHQFFKFHEARSRLFLVVISCFVHLVNSFLGRWKCPFCNRTFTYYPEHAIPYKNYVKDSIVNLSQTYVEYDNITYRQVVQHGISVIAYKAEKGIDERCLAGSTVYRWLSWIGSLKEPLRHALNMIRQKDPSCYIFRQIRPISSHKYQSINRIKILDTCLRFFAVEKKYNALFNRSIFPRFATGFI